MPDTRSRHSTLAGSPLAILNATAPCSEAAAAPRALAQTCWAAFLGAALEVLDEPEPPPHPTTAPQHTIVTTAVRIRPAA